MGHGGRRPGAGRKTAVGEPRTLTKALRFTPGEWARIEKKAREQGITPSELIRLAVEKFEGDE